MKIKVAHVRDFMNQWDRGEMSFPMMAHKLNEVAQDNWISVKDRLPEIVKDNGYGKESEPMLCLHKDGHHEDCIYCISEDMPESPYWYYVQDREYTETVTHWMPLPEPPEE